MSDNQPKHVQYSQTLIDCDFKDGIEEEGSDILNRIPWQASVIREDDSMEVVLRQEGMNDETGFQISLDIRIENGVPFIRVFNDQYGDQAATISIDDKGVMLARSDATAKFVEVFDKFNDKAIMIEAPMQYATDLDQWRTEQRRRLIAEKAATELSGDTQPGKSRPKI